MIIRAATPHDKNTLVNFEQAVVEAERPFNSSIKEGEPTYYNLDDLISSAQAKMLVVEVNNTLIGCGYGQIRASKPSLAHEKHLYLGFMYVVPDFRGQGINKKIMDALIEWGKGEGIQDFYLDVYSGNKAAISAYEKLNFEQSMIEMKLSL